MDGLKFTTKYLTCSFLLVHTYWAVVFYIIGERFSDIISVIRAKLCSESIMDGILTWLVLDQVWIKSSTLLYTVSLSFGSLKLFIKLKLYSHISKNNIVVFASPPSRWNAFCHVVPDFHFVLKGHLIIRKYINAQVLKHKQGVHKIHKYTNTLSCGSRGPLCAKKAFYHASQLARYECLSWHKERYTADK